MLNANLANGRGGKLNYFGGTYSADYGDGWKVDDHFVVGGGQLNTNALFSGPNPKPLGYYLYGCNTAQPAASCSSTNKPVDSDTLGLPAGTNVQANYVGGGAVPLNQSVIHQGWWYIQKQIHTFNNDFRLSKELFDGNTLTAGYYFARSTDNDNWSLGNQMLMTNTNNAKPITVSYVQNGHTYYVTNPQGFTDFNDNFDVSENGGDQPGVLSVGFLEKPAPGCWMLPRALKTFMRHRTPAISRPSTPMANPYILYDKSRSVTARLRILTTTRPIRRSPSARTMSWLTT